MGSSIVLKSKVFFASLVNLIYPKSCLTCKKPLGQESQNPICGQCWDSIKKNQPLFCYRLNKQYFDRAYAVSTYESVLKECIHLLKYNGKLSLAKPLAGLLVYPARFYASNIDLITYVPLHAAKQREREFNQSEVLARHLSKVMNIPVSANNLVRIKNTRPQVKLSGEERHINIKGAFEIKNKNILKDKNILLVDDVFTTGATVDECAKVLKQAGVKKVEVLVLARGN